MMDVDVSEYIFVFENNAPFWTINEAIIDRATVNYPSHLVGKALERAQLEVRIMRYTDSWGAYHHNLHLLTELFRLDDCITNLTAQNTTLASQVASLEQQVADMVSQNASLAERIAALEAAGQ